MKLIVGLGNPGKEYEMTRHNVGFLCLSAHLESLGLATKLDKKFNGIIAEENRSGEKIYYLMPQTYMNLSGNAVYAVANYYHIPIEDILIIYDDMDIPFGSLRLREQGTAGGHNGMKNILMNLASLNIKRVRIGISSPQFGDAKDYVLSKFTKEELEKLNVIKVKVSNIIEDFVQGKKFQIIMANNNGDALGGDTVDC